MNTRTALLALLAGLALRASAADLASSFDLGSEGWRPSTNTAAVAWQNSGGTPDGYLRGSGANTPWYFVSPPKWAGDWRAYRVLKFDLALVNRQYPDAARNGLVVLRGTNGLELVWSGLSPEFTWTHYEVQLLPSAFQVDQATFDSVLQGVSELRLLGEYTTASEQVGLDNVVVTSQGPVSPTNDLMSLFSSGTEGWRPVDDVTLVHTTAEFDGNGGGKLRGDDWADGRVYWFASPVSWAGDWSQFKTLLFDLALTGGTGTIDGANLRLLGANGQQLEASLGIPSSGAWRHYTVDLSPATFGVTADFFAGVMAHVSEMRLRGEYINGGESELLDNVIVTRQLRFPLVAHDLLANFDAGLEDWRIVGNGTPQWSAAGGNPDGFLRGSDGGSGVWYFVSPESWSGDWSLFKQIRFQMKFLSGAYGTGATDLVHLRTYDGQELVAGGVVQAYSWTPYTLDLTPTNFGVDRATFDAAIRNVKELWIRGESTGVGDDTSGLDGVVVTRSDAPVIPPDRLTRFDTGTEGWRASGGVSISWRSSGGHPDGYLNGSDGNSDRWGFASPEAWCGDWRFYRLLAFDYRIVSGSYGFGLGDFVQILGANGQILVGGIPQPNNTWTRYEVPLTAAHFGVSEEVFAQVMHNVVQVVLLAETVSGDDQEAIDNVALTRASATYLTWRDQHWISPDRENDLISGVSADPDGDGADNWSEFTAGTAPTNRLDFFRLESLTPAPDGCQVILRSQPGRLYGLETRSRLDSSSPWASVTNDLPGTGDPLCIPVATPTSTHFFRATVRRQE